MADLDTFTDVFVLEHPLTCTSFAGVDFADSGFRLLPHVSSSSRTAFLGSLCSQMRSEDGQMQSEDSLQRIT